MGSKPDHSRCTLQQGSGVWLQPECGRWVAYLSLETLCSGKRLTPSQALRNGELPAKVLRQYSILVVLKLSSIRVC